MPKIVAKDLSETTVRKLKKLKREQGFGSKTWGEWFTQISRQTRLIDTQTENIMKTTGESFRALWMDNFALNLPLIRDDCFTLRDLVIEENGSAIAVGAGPSVWKNKHLEMLGDSGYKGTVIATDRMLIPCLEHGIIPYASISVDGNRELVEKFYDHPLVDKYGSRIKAVLHSTVAPNVPKRCLKAKMPVHWFHGISDDCRRDGTTTAILWMTQSKRNTKGIVSMMAGGNTGTASWVLAWHVLKRNPVALIGFDFGYPEGTPLEKTPYWSTFTSIDPDPMIASLKAQTFYEEVYHPIFKTKTLICPVFKAYRQFLYEMLEFLPPHQVTWNCTGGGTLFHRHLACGRLKDYLKLAAEHD